MSRFSHRKFTLFLSTARGMIVEKAISGKSILIGGLIGLVLLSTFVVFITKFSCNLKMATEVEEREKLSMELDDRIDELSNIYKTYNIDSSGKWGSYNQFAQLYDMGTDINTDDIAGVGGLLVGEDSKIMMDERMKGFINTYYKLNYEVSHYEELLSNAELQKKVRESTPTLKPTEGSYTSPFGWRFGGTHFHKGLDIANPCGTPIYASADGVVTRAGPAPSYGMVIYIDHGFGMSTRYGHLSGLCVAEGETVKRGQMIAEMGRSGWATGCHLHYEVRINGIAVDPMGFIIEGEIVD